MRRDAVERRARSLISNAGQMNPPIDVSSIASMLDIRLREAELPEGVSGVLEKNPQGRSTIVVNKDHAEVRRRFTAAHEIGHFCLSNRTGVTIDRAMYFRDSRSHMAIDEEEIAANTFAAELLMPTQMVKREIADLIRSIHATDDDQIIIALADRFKVSTTAMSIKLQNLGFRFAIA